MNEARWFVPDVEYIHPDKRHATSCDNLPHNSLLTDKQNNEAFALLSWSRKRELLSGKW
jgi:hypothetical protein